MSVELNPKERFARNEDRRRQIGFSAQEVEILFPEMVHTDINGYKAIAYSRLTPVLVEAIKAQQQQIDAQRTQLDLQGMKIEQMEKQLLQLHRAAQEE